MIDKELPVLTSITYEGQPYIDEPITAKPAKSLLTILADELAEIYGYIYYIKENGMNIRKRADLPPELLIGYNHQRLRWVKPDGHGNLIPK